MSAVTQNNIDLGLSILCALQQPGQILTQDDIAEVCGCSRSAIYYLEKKALAKLEKWAQCQNKTDYL